MVLIFWEGGEGKVGAGLYCDIVLFPVARVLLRSRDLGGVPLSECRVIQHGPEEEEAGGWWGSDWRISCAGAHFRGDEGGCEEACGALHQGAVDGLVGERRSSSFRLICRSCITFLKRDNASVRVGKR